MLTFRQMEQYHDVVDLINRYEAMIGQIGSGISAKSLDSVRSGSYSDPHRTEEQVIQKEKALVKLRQLRQIQDEYLPKVEETISEATAKSKASVRLRHQLILKMRYEHGRSWEEIEDILKIRKPATIVIDLLEEKQNDS